MKKIRRYFWNRYAIAGVVILAVIAFFVLRSRNTAPSIEYATAKVGDIVEKVSVTGKISAQNKVDLSFEKSGTVRSLPKAIGESVKKDEIMASLNSAGDEAALASAKAELLGLTRGLRPEEYQADKAAVDAASTSLNNAERNALIAIRDSYVKAESAVVNYADNFFTNPQSVNPTINIRTSSSEVSRGIEGERLSAGEALANWRSLFNAPQNSRNAAKLIHTVQTYLDTIKTLTSDLGSSVNDLSPGNSGLSQNAIDADVSAMNSSLAILSQAITSLGNADTAMATAKAALEQSTNQFYVQVAGSSADAIAAQKAKVAQVQAELDKDHITSPIDGVLTKADPEIGQFVAAGVVAFSVQSAGAYKIEAYVPEADIAKVSVGNKAEVTLDAYGSGVIFPATVTAVDPAETVLEGVPTYKVTLNFDQNDDRILSGMTANTDILTRRHDTVVIVPSRAVSSAADGKKSVRLLAENGKDFTSVPVMTGLKGSDGMIEIVSGLNAGDKVVTYVK